MHPHILCLKSNLIQTTFGESPNHFIASTAICTSYTSKLNVLSYAGRDVVAANIYNLSKHTKHFTNIHNKQQHSFGCTFRTKDKHRLLQAPKFKQETNPTKLSVKISSRFFADTFCSFCHFDIFIFLSLFVFCLLLLLTSHFSFH